MTMTNEIDPTEPTNPNRYGELTITQQVAVDELINAIASAGHTTGLVDLIGDTTRLVHHAAGFGSDR